MTEPNIYLGNNLLKTNTEEVSGTYLTIENEQFYKIANYDRMRPFFVSLVSHSDHWLFIASNGGLTVGRRNENSALLPYYTDDKIMATGETTGSKTLIKIHENGKILLWEPFSERCAGIYKISRDLYKNGTGNKIIFEEINQDMKLSFSYSWQFSEKFGIVKKSTLTNWDKKSATVEVLDGIQNILPYGVGAALQNQSSNLVNAYKRNELHQASGLGIFSLSAMIVDKAEPAEALKATTVWHAGIEAECVLLSLLQINNFKKGIKLNTETDIKAEAGAYFIKSNLALAAESKTSWVQVAELNQDHSSTAKLINQLKKDKNKIIHSLELDIEAGSQSLKKLAAMADGLQATGDELSVGRHFSNVLFNIMRGGIFTDQYRVEKSDLIDYFNTINKKLTTRQAEFFNDLPETLNYNRLLESAEKNSDADLIRICYEYLPLSFSRRHGDPSRPWNKFSIDIKNKDGSKLRNYQGNWRDIFQNWEALAFSFPGYIRSMITRFVNASTIDGYNPYRIMRSGIDWEIVDPDDAWSFIGYWGDHQIIYLLKLMELAENYCPEDLRAMLQKPIFVFANVPYRIKKYEEIVRNPKDTISFDELLEKRICEKVQQVGADGKLIVFNNDEPIKANLAEKLLVSLLAKLSNFIPEAGIWLNTQRPEWNDANNALVGNGTSMVTLYYLRRFVNFCIPLFDEKTNSEIEFHQPVAEMLGAISKVLEENQELLQNKISDNERRKVADLLGKIGESYREEAYSEEAYRGFDRKKVALPQKSIQDFLELSLQWIDHSIRVSKREDGLYHAYNLVTFEDEKLSISPLYEMLEGQVAALSAGVLDADEALKLLDKLKAGKMYRPDQYSYMLYPDRNLPGFLSKNTIPSSFVEGSALAKALLQANDTGVIQKDENDIYHFNSDFTNKNDLVAALARLRESDYAGLAEVEHSDFMEAFEQVFNHRAFTGRSGTFFGYEGLGSIYWHMVSKLLVAVQENIYKAKADNAAPEIIGRMIDHYYEIRAGIGINKSPELYGAFPTDPYSHTPAGKGAQQPGMTGQVKEDILNRWAELGVRIHKGILSFEPLFLKRKEFLQQPSVFRYFDVNGTPAEIELNKGELAFTYCQHPVVYALSNENSITIYDADGEVRSYPGKSLSARDSSALFSRSGSIRLVRVYQGF